MKLCVFPNDPIYAYFEKYKGMGSFTKIKDASQYFGVLVIQP